MWETKLVEPHQSMFAAVCGTVALSPGLPDPVTGRLCPP